MDYKAAHFRKRPTATEWEYFVQGEIPFVQRLCPELKPILDAELDAGNQIWSASGGWPESDSIFIVMVEPFKKNHEARPGVTFEETNDPHYWKDAYFSENPKHFVVCQFKR